MKFGRQQKGPPEPGQEAREEAYRANNLGVALLEQFKYKEGADAFRRALQIDPHLLIARINLAIALYNVPDIDGAMREARAAIEADPKAPQPHYILGLIARAQNRADDAIKSFARVLEIDPSDVGASVNLGQILAQQRRYPEAIAAFRRALAAEPYNITASYSLAQALLRAGQREEGQRLLKEFQELRQSGAGTSIGTSYLEQGRYAEAVVSTGAEPGLVDAATPDVTFADATTNILPGAQKTTPAAGVPVMGRSFKAAELNDAAKAEIARAFSGGMVLFDYDGDGDLDLFEVLPEGNRLQRNDGGRFTDVTQASGLAGGKGVGIGAVAGDYDNDGRPDLFVLRYGGNALYHNDGGGKFADVTAAAGIPPYPFLAISAALVDVDHDGDLDILIAGFVDLARAAPGGANQTLTFPGDFPAAPNMLLRNNGDGKFTDVTAEAKIAGPAGRAMAVVPTDYDNRRDVDLLILNYGAAPTLFRNLRNKTFRDVAAEVGLGVKGDFVSVAAGDVNKDNYTDFYFGSASGAGIFALSDGRGRFVTSSGPAGAQGASAAQFLDYDNDGLLDLVAISERGVRVWRNIGNRWVDASERAVERDLAAGGAPAAARAVLASGDLDGDGDTDLLAREASGALRAARNEGGNRQHSIRIQLAGRVSNRSGIGAKVEARAGSLRQKLETYAASPAPAPADVIFGLGARTAPDAVRILWPAGIVQAETEFAASGADARKTALSLAVTELDRKPSSCPYLFAWNGERFEFITDFMGGGEMGYWVAPGIWNQPDPDEYVRIRGDQLKARNGRFELRVTNELEEVLYLDRLQLIAVTHPENVEVFPDEGLAHSPRPFRLYAARDMRPPVAAFDDHGHDVRARIERMDRQYPDDFRKERIRGYAEEHTLTLDLGPSTPEKALLLLTGWTDYAFSSDNVAAAQRGLSLVPPSLQVKDARGHWQTVIKDIGIPVGRPQTLVVDLAGKFPTANREVRLVTNMRIYWDQIQVAAKDREPARLTRLEPLVADLRWRGFSAETSPDHREPWSYDYERVSFASPWKVMPGRYTREGDVRELLGRVDDMFVVSRPGDEIALSFDATRLPPLPAGARRTFLLYADGFSKEMDINSASPDRVAPLPFHGMKSYPYTAPDAYPMTPARRAYIERYNTRVVTVTVPQLLTGAARPGTEGR
jgi:tetratricopeptide (TPR) repeat protein